VVAEHVPPTVGVIEPVDAGSCILTIGSDSIDALALQTALLDLEFAVLAPPELAQRLAELGTRLSAASQARLAGHPS
jgi:hypothetical protein